MNRRDFLGLAGLGGLAMALSPVAVFAQQDVSLEGRIAQLQQEVQADPKNPDLHFELSKLYEEDVEKYYDQSLSEFKVAVDNGLKGKTVMWNGLGDVNAHNGAIALQAGNYDKAIRNFEAAAKFNPNHPVMYGNIGVAYSRKGNQNKAIEYEKKAIDLDPSNSVFHETIGAMYLENRDFKMGLLNLNKTLYLTPENKRIYKGIAKAYHGLGEYSNAIEVLDQLPRDLRKHDDVKALRKECVGLLNN